MTTPKTSKITAVSGPKLSATSVVSEDYRTASAIADPRQIALARNSEGLLELYTVGSNGNIHHFRRSTTPAGWTRVDTKLSATLIAGDATDPSDANQRVFATSQAPAALQGPIPLTRVSQIVQNPQNGAYELADVGFTTYSADRLFVAHVHPGAEDESFEILGRQIFPNGVAPEPGAFFADFRPGQALPREVFGNFQTSTGLLLPSAAEFSSLKVQAHFGLLRSTAVAYSPRTPHVLHGGAPEGLSFSTSQFIAADELIANETKQIRSTNPILATASVGGGPATSMVFAVDGTNRVQSLVLDSSLLPAGELTPVPLAFEPDVTQPKGFKGVEVVLGGDRVSLCLFLIASDDKVWFAERNPAGEWSSLIQTGVSGQTLTLGYNAGDPSDPTLLRLFSVFDKRIVESWRNADGVWESREVMYDSPTDLEVQNVYRVRLTVSDREESGVLMLRADRDLRLLVDGRRRYLASNGALALATDDGGGVSLTIDLLDDFGAPTLDVRFESEDGSAMAALSYRPDAPVFETFRTSTTAMFTQARDPNAPDKPLFPASEVDSLQQLSSGAMQAIGSFFGAPPAPDFAFAYDRKSGRGRYRRIDTAEFDARAAAADAQREQTMAAYHAALGRGSSFSWGGLWSAVKSGALELAEVVVKTGKVIISVILNGKPTDVGAFDLFPSRAWEALQGFFSEVGAAAAAVGRWIADTLGGLLDFGKVKAQKDQLKAMVKAFLTDLAKSAGDPTQFADPIKRWVNATQQNLDQQIAAISSQPDIQNSPRQLGISLPAIPGVGAALESIRWLIERLSEALEGSISFPSLAVSGLADAFANWLSTVGEDLQDDLQNLVALVRREFSRLVANGGSLADVAIETFLGLAKIAIDGLATLINDTVDGALAVAKVLLDAVPAALEWLDGAIELPFFSAFYKKIFGQAPSFLDIAALFAASALVITGNPLSTGEVAGVDGRAIAATAIYGVFNLITPVVIAAKALGFSVVIFGASLTQYLLLAFVGAIRFSLKDLSQAEKTIYITGAIAVGLGTVLSLVYGATFFERFRKYQTLVGNILIGFDVVVGVTLLAAGIAALVKQHDSLEERAGGALVIIRGLSGVGSIVPARAKDPRVLAGYAVLQLVVDVVSLGLYAVTVGAIPTAERPS